jgi:hypothetical protein
MLKILERKIRRAEAAGWRERERERETATCTGCTRGRIRPEAGGIVCVREREGRRTNEGELGSLGIVFVCASFSARVRKASG